jgi:hypothetical protein
LFPGKPGTGKAEKARRECSAKGFAVNLGGVFVNGRVVNAVELRQSDVLNWIEFETVCDTQWAELGFAEFGHPVTFAGVLTGVENGHTGGRGWSRVRVKVTAPATGKRTEIVSVLGAHRTVTLTALD